MDFGRRAGRGFWEGDELLVALRLICTAASGKFFNQLDNTTPPMFDLPSLDGVDEVLISQQVVEGIAGPLYMYAAHAGGARAT